ncbi:hypothetical protein TUMSATVNIG1_49590 [Vibrio nigripulchritudo]|uniref:hypothetical protein n=1 Tax=Vibrio nigripulchritudo TaxID=28173 RepID=UPI00190D61BC|nr:hypothetical protein [Vibrio nigripulchritudo]BCL72986.1 hypothetical protein VNTUMSATTG_49230 [Vibrio nigripulchritudo]BDU34350.1 hypothetical protein TUMSATVNIG1_49590 [Vibrio nigripulchritudo]
MKKILVAALIASATFSAQADTSLVFTDQTTIAAQVIAPGSDNIRFDKVPDAPFERRFKAKPTDNFSKNLSGYSYWHAKDVKVTVGENGALFNTLKVSTTTRNSLEIAVAKNANNPVFDVYINNTKFAENIDSTNDNILIAAHHFRSAQDYINVQLIPVKGSSSKTLVIDSIRISTPKHH